MIGAEGGIGGSVLFALIFLIVTPLLTVSFLNQIGTFNNLKRGHKRIVIILSFVILMAITLLITRTFPYTSLDGFLYYSIFLIVALIVNSIRKSRLTKDKKPAANNAQPPA